MASRVYFTREITPEKVLHVLETEENSVEISEEVRQRALVPLERMLALAK